MPSPSKIVILMVLVEHNILMLIGGNKSCLTKRILLQAGAEELAPFSLCSFHESGIGTASSSTSSPKARF